MINECHLSSNIKNEPRITQIISPIDNINGIWKTSAGQESSPITIYIYEQGSSPPDQYVHKA